MSDHSNKHRISVPSIAIPSRSGPADGLSSMGSSNPSPMTVLSNFLADNLTGGGEFRGSFTQLLAMASPSAAAAMAAAGGGGTAATAALGGISSSGLMGLGETPSSFWGEMSENNGSGQKNGGSGGENNKLPGSGSGSGSVAAFKQNRPAGLMVPVSTSSLFPVSPGFSPSAFLNSPPPGFFSPTLSSFGMSHQQALAQVTAQAAALSQSQSNTHHPSSSSAPAPLPPFNPLATNHHQQYIFETPTSHTTTLLSSDPNHLKLGQTSQHPPPDSHTSQFSDHHYQLPAPVDKPAEDGYNWRKYGQKQVKGSEYPRSYYRCTHLNCPVKKKVERSRDGHITEIIYKGQHNHGKPQIGRRGASKDNNAVAIEGSGSQGQIGVGLQQWSNGGGLLRSGGGGDEDAATSIQLHGPSDSEEESGEAADHHDAEDHERDGKRRNTGAAGTCEISMSTHKTVTEPKIIVQTRSRVDLLDDGYRWRKYGQKVVKGNPNPRSYYKCTTVGCTVRKHVERSSKDAEAVITTYEGKHNHDVPVGRNNNNSNNNANAQQRLQNNNNAAASAGAGDVRQSSLNYQEVDFQFREERPVAFLRLKEERYHN